MLWPKGGREYPHAAAAGDGRGGGEKLMDQIYDCGVRVGPYGDRRDEPAACPLRAAWDLLRANGPNHLLRDANPGRGEHTRHLNQLDFPQ